MNEKCPDCGVGNIREEVGNYTFSYGIASKAVELEVELPFLICSDCGFEYTDHRAETIKDDAVRHLENA